MRGVGQIVAVTVAAEIGDFSRFANPRQLMAYLGLRAERTLERQHGPPRWDHPGLATLWPGGC